MFSFLFPIGFAAATIHLTTLMFLTLFANYIQKNGWKFPLNVLSLISGLASITFIVCVILMFLTFHSPAFNIASIFIVVGMVLLLRAKKSKQSQTTLPAPENAEDKVVKNIPLSTMIFVDSIYLLTMLMFLIPFFATMIFK